MPRVTTAPWAAVRWSARAPRAVLLLALAAFCVAGIRAALRPPPAAPAPAHAVPAAIDTAADAFAQAFVRAYLTWDAAHPQVRERALRAQLAADLDPDAGVSLPPNSRQRVRWTIVEGSATATQGRRVVVAAGTTGGEWHLAVDVAEGPGGTMAVAGYPALVGPPPADLTAAPPHQEDVGDPALLTVTRRVVANYLGRSRSNLAADLTGGGLVVLPSAPLRVSSVESTRWVRRASLVAVTVRASRRDRLHLTLTYELSVVRRAGRWLVSGVQFVPHPKEIR